MRYFKTGVGATLIDSSSNHISSCQAQREKKVGKDRTQLPSPIVPSSAPISLEQDCGTESGDDADTENPEISSHETADSREDCSTKSPQKKRKALSSKSAKTCKKSKKKDCSSGSSDVDGAKCSEKRKASSKSSLKSKTSKRSNLGWIVDEVEETGSSLSDEEDGRFVLEELYANVSEKPDSIFLQQSNNDVGNAAEESELITIEGSHVPRKKRFQLVN